MAAVPILIQAGIFLLTFASFIHKVNQDRKRDYDALMVELRDITDGLRKERDERIGRCYERLDEVKKDFERKVETVEGSVLGEITSHRKDAEDKYVEIKICKILHDQSDRTQERLEGKIDQLSKKMDLLISHGKIQG